MAKGTKTGGRQKGSLNKRTRLVEDIAAKFKLDPFEVLMMVANYDWKGLGYETESTIAYTNAGIEYELPRIALSDRVAAAKEAAKYIYPQKKSVEMTLPEASGLKIIVEDYTATKPK